MTDDSDRQWARDRLAEEARDQIGRIAVLQVRCARLAAALTQITEGTPFSTEKPAVRFLQDIARAAITADDRKAAEEWRALERVSTAADAWRKSYGQTYIAAHQGIYDALDALAALREGGKE